MFNTVYFVSPRAGAKQRVSITITKKKKSKKILL